VILHLLLEDIYQTQQMIMALENTTGVAGIEIGMPPDLDPALVEQVSELISSELPLILRLPFEKADQLSGIAGQAFHTSFIALSVAPPRGMLIDANGIPVGGRLYGPALYTQTLALTSKLVASGIPIIIGGGIYYRSQVEELLEMGATAVLLDAILWRGGMLSGRASGPE
jgi:dihydroorotate dehydrogenase